MHQDNVGVRHRRQFDHFIVGSQCRDIVNYRGSCVYGLFRHFGFHRIDRDRQLRFFPELLDYRDKYQERLASRTQFSFATTKGSSSDDKSVKLAIGFRFTFWDRGDPRIDLSEDGLIERFFRESIDPAKVGTQFNEFRAKTEVVIPKVEKEIERLKNINNRSAPEDIQLHELQQKLETLIKDTSDDSLQQKLLQIEKSNRELRNKLSQEIAKKKWNASSWALGIAPTWISDDGSIDNMESQGFAAYSTLAYGFEDLKGLADKAQLVAHIRFRKDDIVPDPAQEGSFFKQDTLIAGFQARLRGPTIGNKVGGRDLSFAFEGSYIYADRENGETDSSYRYVLSGDIKLTDNLYFKLSLGNESGRKDINDQGFVIGNLKFGF